MEPIYLTAAFLLGATFYRWWWIDYIKRRLREKDALLVAEQNRSAKYHEEILGRQRQIQDLKDKLRWAEADIERLKEERDAKL